MAPGMPVKAAHARSGWCGEGGGGRGGGRGVAGVEVMGRVVERSAVAVAEEQTTEAAAEKVAGRARW